MNGRYWSFDGESVGFHETDEAARGRALAAAERRRSLMGSPVLMTDIAWGEVSQRANRAGELEMVKPAQMVLTIPNGIPQEEVDSFVEQLRASTAQVDRPQIYSHVEMEVRNPLVTLAPKLVETDATFAPTVEQMDEFVSGHLSTLDEIFPVQHDLEAVRAVLLCEARHSRGLVTIDDVSPAESGDGWTVSFHLNEPTWPRVREYLGVTDETAQQVLRWIAEFRAMGGEVGPNNKIPLSALNRPLPTEEEAHRSLWSGAPLSLIKAMPRPEVQHSPIGIDRSILSPIVREVLAEPCDCDLMDRRWNPLTERCERCNRAYVRGR